MVDVDVALGILADAVCVAVLDAGRRFPPIVEAFVLVIAFAKNMSETVSGCSLPSSKFAFTR